MNQAPDPGAAAVRQQDSVPAAGQAPAEAPSMWERAYMDVQAVLDRALGTEEEHGAGAGIAADVALLAAQRDDARARARRLGRQLENLTRPGLFEVTAEPASGPRFRPGDQAPPLPNSNPSIHDLVIADIGHCAASGSQKDAARALIAARKELGLSRYQTLLQCGNGRDWHRDFLDEVTDACAYLRQGLEETGAQLGSDLDRVYRQLLHLLCLVAGGLPMFSADGAR